MYDKNVVTFGANNSVEFIFNLTKNNEWYNATLDILNDSKLFKIKVC